MVCETLPAPRHGRVHYTHTDDQTGVVRFPSAATVDCEHGYTPSDAAPRQCQLDGTWSVLLGRGRTLLNKSTAHL